MPALKNICGYAAVAALAALTVGFLAATGSHDAGAGNLIFMGMAVIGGSLPTYKDLAGKMDPKGAIANVIEVLTANNSVVNDMQVKPANDGTGHKTTIRTGIAQAAWRMLNYGVPRVKSRTMPVRDTTGMLAAYMEVDKTLADLSGNVNAFRNSEDAPVREGMTQQVAETFWYGNTDATPERFLGLSPRYSSLSAPSGTNIIDFGGTGSDNTSMWLLTWGENCTYGIHPDTAKAGLDMRDLGEVTLLDANGGQFQGYRSYVEWHLGLTVRDWRMNVRIANIDVSDLLTDNGKAKLLDCIIDAEEAIPEAGGQSGTQYWYGNKTVRSAIRKAVTQGIANTVTEENILGKKVTHINGVPFSRSDALINAEARVV